MRIALAQMDPTVGDIRANIRKIGAWIDRAKRLKADLVLFPEMCVTGYPPRDLVESPHFIIRNRQAVEDLAARVSRPAVVLGFIDVSTLPGNKGLHNSAALLANHRVAAVRHKTLLPAYDVFDESRHFAPALSNDPIPWRGHRLGLTICEDMWHVPSIWPQTPYRQDPIKGLARHRADILINISSSPFQRGKTRLRLDLIRHHARRRRRPFLFVNQVGGNDEVLFDGHSLAVNANGEIVAQAKGFREDLVVFDSAALTPLPEHEESELEQIREALVMGLRDYTRKCGFDKVVLGLSGGIDSAVTAALAVEALGPANVLGVSMPSPYSSRGSVQDVRTLAKNLGLRLLSLPITPVFSAFKNSLKPAFHGRRPDVTEENLQARIRGTLLMAMSNKFGMLLLTTGNKSELSMGYCTLYGDMNGGLAVISDVMKTQIYKLGRLLNERRAVIPEACFTKPPSAELRPNQTDQDSLPPYEVLDAIVEAYVEEGKDVAEIQQLGYPKSLVEKVLLTIDRNEYKRRQAPPGLRISSKAFGMGRRMPIARGDFRA
jgi:NAD+ synthase (glutamine-hydrolysing)